MPFTNHTRHCVISLSGGMDSSALLAWLMSEQKYDHFWAYAIDYGQRHEVELDKSEELVEFLKTLGLPVSYQRLNLRDVFSDSQSALNTRAGVEVPKDSYSLEVSKQTVVENRNVVFSSVIYSKALALSKKYDVYVDIALGVHASDSGTYPDTRPESIEAAKNLYKISNWGSERIDYVAPFVTLNKTEVLGRGLEALAALGIPYDAYFSKTSSCYDPIEYHGINYSCGLCATCRDRLAAFEAYQLKDPILYSEDYTALRAEEAKKDLANMSRDQAVS